MATRVSARRFDVDEHGDYKQWLSYEDGWGQGSVLLMCGACDHSSGSHTSDVRPNARKRGLCVGQSSCRCARRQEDIYPSSLLNIRNDVPGVSGMYRASLLREIERRQLGISGQAGTDMVLWCERWIEQIPRADRDREPYMAGRALDAFLTR